MSVRQLAVEDVRAGMTMIWGCEPHVVRNVRRDPWGNGWFVHFIDFPPANVNGSVSIVSHAPR